MEPFDRWTKIRRCFQCILWLEDYHDLGYLFKGDTLAVVGLLGLRCILWLEDYHDLGYLFKGDTLGVVGLLGLRSLSVI